MFLFGMNLMSDHLKKMASSKTQMILYKMTNKPVKSVFIGAGVTALMQSSGAVCAMVVGLIESDIIKLRQGIGIILGTILGTSITGWIVAYSSVHFTNPIAKLFSASYISAIFAIVGIVFKLFIKKQQIKRLGEIFLGFSILMLGIYTITDAVAPLKENTTFLKTVFGQQNPLLLLLMGITLSALLQSASAAVGMVQTFSVTGIITWNTVIPLLAGIGIGASVPVLLAAVGKNREAKKGALSYLIINTLGAAVIGVLFMVVGVVTPKEILLNPLSIAEVNTIYRLIILLLTIPFIGGIEALCNCMMLQLSGIKRRVILNKSL